MKKVFISAGGTGGHINAALSLGESLEQDFDVHYLSGTRYLDYDLFKGKNCTHLKSIALRSKNPVKILTSLVKNTLVFLQILMLYLGKRPSFIVGAGGYVCGPTLLAGKILGIPIFIIEQNAVVGLTNKILSKISNRIFTNFKETKGLESVRQKVIKTGNPVRKNILFNPNEVNTPINILVFGGSLGATQINDAIEDLAKAYEHHELNIVHQVGKNNLKEISGIKPNIKYEQLEYIKNMDEMYAWANIVIARAGASTVSELRIVKRPAVIIPYPKATDNHQFYNAQNLKEEDGFYVEVLDQTLERKELSPKLSSSIFSIIDQEKFYTNETPEEKAVEAIKEEILKYVRN